MNQKKDREERTGKFKRNLRICDFKTCRVISPDRKSNLLRASLTSLSSWVSWEFLSALDFRLRNTVGLTILDSTRGERQGKHSEFREGNFVVPFIYSEIPSYLRESHVPFLGYLLSREIADLETIRGTRSCVEHDGKVGMCGHQAKRIRQVCRRTQLKVRLAVRSTRSSTVLVDNNIFFSSHHRHCDLVQWYIERIFRVFVFHYRRYIPRCSYILSAIF